MRHSQTISPGDRFYTTDENGSAYQYGVADDGTPHPYVECLYTFAHTRKWCGNPLCREN